MYTILDKEHIASKDEVSYDRVHIQVDTETDIPEPDASWVVGSSCFIAEDHSFKVLNSAKEWV